MKNLCLLFLLAVPLFVLGQDFPARSNKLVNDYSGTLSSNEVSSLEQLLVDYDRESSVQISIVIMKTLDGYPIDDYAFSLGEKWGIGQAGTDNGALLVISMEERKMWIATGYGLEGTLTDALCKRIIENEIKPHFKNEDYYEGLAAGSNAMILATRGEYEGSESGEESPARVIILVMSIFGFFWIIFWLFAAVEAKRYARLNNLSFWAAWALLNSASKSHGGSWSSFSGGSGGFSSGGGGSSFGGFGGGSFGGGGAGGSW